MIKKKNIIPIYYNVNLCIENVGIDFFTFYSSNNIMSH